MSSEWNVNDNCGDPNFTENFLPKELEDMIDNAVAQDFRVIPISAADRQNDMYKAIRFSLNLSQINVLYERKVLSDKAPVIPAVQFLFGFRPADGLCVFTNKKEHKEMLCDSPIRELSKSCFLTQSLQYILIEADNFRVWGYIPVCCSSDTCPAKTRDFEMRKSLFS
jgi:hypothetical protein